MDPTLDDLVRKLDLETKLRLISGAGAWTTQACEEIGLRPVSVSDGPVGVRGPIEDERDWSATMPSSSALAATWDEELLHRVGALLAAEAVRKDVDVALGPTVNLHRSPLGGRHFECFSEDPLLTGRMAAAYVRGLQDNGVGACPKHFVANDAETDRTSVDIRVDERTLRELYLAPFDHLVTEAGPWTVMAAYNGVDGAPMTESPLLREVLKDEWGWDGLVVSDWGAVYGTEESASAALDLAMPGPSEHWGEPLLAAVREGRVPEAAIDDKVRSLLRLAARVGALDGHPAAAGRPSPGTVEQGAALAREAATAAMVLVRNDGDLLPLANDNLSRVALLGPGALEARPLGGGSATVFPPYVVSPLEGLRSALGDRVELVTAPGASLSDDLRTPRARELSQPGTLRWLDATGACLKEEPTEGTHFVRDLKSVEEGSVSLELRTVFTADTTGDWQLGVSGVGAFVLDLDGETVVDTHIVRDPLDIGSVVGAAPQEHITRRLTEGQKVDVRLRFTWGQDIMLFWVGLVVGEPRLPADQQLARAVELAAASDVAVVVVGTTEAVESEGFDRTTLRLPGDQDALVHAVAAANPRTVVVVNSGAPVEMPWRDEVAALLLAWFPGMELGNALADVLLGAVEPGGRLPTTWPARDEDVPVWNTTPRDGVLEYTEGLHIGHRAYLREGTEPAYWFGHGLGYTTWEYESFDVPAHVRPGEDLTVTVRVRNSGERHGKEVVQVYAARPDSAVERPELWLAGFAVAKAGPGETVDVPVRIAARALQHWSVTGHQWQTESGAFLLSAGRSACRPLLTDETVVSE
ncbi:beta-glucosidase [Streptomyces pseudovenezuelae]|uniref:beta-glucosidase n=1 Tax=Streptomyces pseudovenezuelae TaxID=67350 RepID=UPI002E31DF9F|nr:glycoside hydrolase family 3 C-terminal domain-containing protein [Streptomyces pseudovenezuelae]